MLFYTTITFRLSKIRNSNICKYQLIKITYSIICKMLLNKCYTNQNIARLEYQNNLAIYHYFYTR